MSDSRTMSNVRNSEEKETTHVYGPIAEVFGVTLNSLKESGDESVAVANLDLMDSMIVGVGAANSSEIKSKLTNTCCEGGGL